MKRERGRIGLILGAIGLVAVGFFVAVTLLQSLPEGPVAVVWDKEPCAWCHMHVGERAFAAQLQTRDRQVLNFDDPGCLFHYVHEHPDLDVHALYFHHLREERWVAADQAGFVRVSPTPMGFGFGAVDAGEPGAVPWREAMAATVSGQAREH